MEEGHLKSKRLSYTAKFKREVIRCAEENGNRKAAAIFGVDESNVRLWRKHKAAISGCEASRRKFSGPEKGRFPEIDDAVFTFFQERRKTGLLVSYDLLREEAIKKARSLNIPRSRFKASKGWVIRFMRRMGLALRRRTTICQKLPKDFEQKLLNYQQLSSEDDIIWEDDVEDEDDSDWVESTDNDSGEGDSISMEPDEVYISSAFSKEQHDPELNSDAVKVERDVDVVSEEDCTDMKTDEVYRPSVLSVKTEYENCTDVLETVPGFCTETCLTACDAAIKVEDGSYVLEEEEDPLAVTLPATKAEQELNSDAVKVERDVDVVSEEDCTDMKTDEVYRPSVLFVKTEYENCTDVLERVPALFTETCLTACDAAIKVEDGSYVSEEEDPLAVTSPATKAEQENTVRQHQLLHSEIHPYSCGVCNKLYADRNSLRKHKHIHIEAQEFSCDVCNKPFRYQSDLKKHHRIHTGERPYSCGVCNKSFSEQGSVKRHQRVHTGERPYTCGVCNKSFRELCKLKEHRRIHTCERPYTCGVCNKSFSQHGILKRHQRIHTGEHPYSCDVCGKSFTHHSSLMEHQSVHTGEYAYTCAVCNKSYSKQSRLKLHQHIHTGERPYTCGICNKSFSAKGILRRHQLIHTGERPYRCGVCNKSFGQRGSLKKHRLIHTGERPYACGVCNKSFRNHSNRKRHQRVHTGECP